jgi:hypothetical protein
MIALPSFKFSNSIYLMAPHITFFGYDISGFFFFFGRNAGEQQYFKQCCHGLAQEP